MIETFSQVTKRARHWGKGGTVAVLLAFWPALGAAQGDAVPPAASSPAAEVSKGSQGTPAVVLDDNGVESLLGKDVKNAAGDKLGRVVDVLVSREGELRAAVIDFGGFLGVGTRKVAVSWLTLGFSDQGLVLKMTADELRVTPEYRQGEPVVVVGPSSAKADKPSGAPPPEK